MISQSEFASIVADAAATMSRIRAATAHGYEAQIEFASRSGRQSVHASLVLDPSIGRFTRIVCAHVGANQPLFFAEEVERRIAAHIPS